MGGGEGRGRRNRSSRNSRHLNLGFPGIFPRVWNEMRCHDGEVSSQRKPRCLMMNSFLEPGGRERGEERGVSIDDAC